MRLSIFPAVLTLAFWCVQSSVAIAAVATQSADGVCVRDDASGLFVPTGRKGLCASADYGSTRLTQRLDHGLVLTLLTESYQNSARVDPYGKPLLRTSDPTALVIYCPSVHVHPDTGRPTAACMSDPEAMIPGPEAFVGLASVTARLTRDEHGRMSCPGSLRVTGELTDPFGARYSFDSAAVLTRTGEGVCHTAFDAMNLRPIYSDGTDPASRYDRQNDPQASYQKLERAVGVIDRMTALKQDDWHALDSLAEFNDEQLAALRWFLTAEDSRLATMNRLLEADGVAWVDESGEVQGANAAEPQPAGSFVVTDTLASDIKAKINQINSRVSGIANRVNIVPVRSDVVALIDQLRGSVDLSQVRGRIEDAGAELKNIADEISERRQGLPEFVGQQDCGAGSECARFRTDLGQLFDNIETLGYAVQQLVCTQIPGINTPGIKFRVIRKVLVDNPRAPKVVLFLMSRVFQQIEDWQLNDLVETLPIDVFEAMCEEARGTQSTFALETTQVIRTSAQNSVCGVLRPEAVRIALKRTSARTGFSDWFIQQMKALFPEDQAVGVNVIAVGGGGFTVTTKGVPATLSELLIANLGMLKNQTDKVIARRDACLADEERWERDLYTCRPKIEYLTNDKGVLKDLFGYMKRQAKAIRDTDVGKEIDRAALATAARKRAETKFANSNFRGAYECICNAYQQLTLDPGEARACKGL